MMILEDPGIARKDRALFRLVQMRLDRGRAAFLEGGQDLEEERLLSCTEK